jgi:hypothetical protein
MTACDRFEEEALLRLEQGEPLDEHFAACPDCLAARAAYERLQEAIAATGMMGTGDEPPPGWQAAVWQRIEERRSRPRWTWALGASAAMAALAAALFFAVPRTPSVPSLVQELIAGGATVRAAAPHPGDRLLLRAETAGAAHAELRVYRNGRDLVLRCPEDVASSACRREGSALRAELTIPSAGTFQAVLVLGDALPPPPGAGLDRDSGAALDRGARVVLGDELTVR